MRPLDVARREGAKAYFTGRPCRSGHVAHRMVSNRTCVECARAATDEWRSDNSESLLEYQRRWNNENRDRLNEASRRWRKNNPEKVRATKAAEHLRNGDKRRSAMARWRKSNPDQCRDSDVQKRRDKPDQYLAHKRNYKMRKRNAEGSHTGVDVLDILRMQKGKCAYCRIELSDKYHVDHIQPLAKGGSNGRKNLQVLCIPCNQTKSAKDPIVFAQSMGLLL